MRIGLGVLCLGGYLGGFVNGHPGTPPPGQQFMSVVLTIAGLYLMWRRFKVLFGFGR